MRITRPMRVARNTVRNVARSALSGPVARERLRLAQPHALIDDQVRFTGTVSDVELGEQVAIFGPTVIDVANGGGLTGSRLSVGPRTYIGEFNNIRCAGAAISIGADCLISQHITIVGTNHGIERGRTIVSQPWHGDGVVIGDDVWIGAGAVILPGARIGDGAVIAANAVVRGEVDAHAIVGGVPARVLGERPGADAPVASKQVQR